MTQAIFSPSAAAVAKANDYFVIAADATLAKKSAVTTARALTNTALAVAATLETVVLAAIATIASPLYFTAKTNPYFQGLKGRVEVATQATKAAATNIFYGKTQSVEVKVISKFEQAKEVAKFYAAKVWNFATDTANASTKAVKAHPYRAAGAVALTAGTAAAYFYGPSASTVLAAAKSAGSSAYNTAASAATWSGAKLGYTAEAKTAAPATHAFFNNTIRMPFFV